MIPTGLVAVGVAQLFCGCCNLPGDKPLRDIAVQLNGVRGDCLSGAMNDWRVSSHCGNKETFELDCKFIAWIHSTNRQPSVHTYQSIYSPSPCIHSLISPIIHPTFCQSSYSSARPSTHTPIHSFIHISSQLLTGTCMNLSFYPLTTDQCIIPCPGNKIHKTLLEVKPYNTELSRWLLQDND